MLGLKAWKRSVVEWKNFGVGQLNGLLPQDPSLLDKLGEVYWLLEPPEELKMGPSLSSNRYYPPMLVDESEIIIHRLLAMVHPRPFVLTRFAPQGSVACVRAYNDRFIDIVFRSVGFQITPVGRPLWQSSSYKSMLTWDL